MSLPDNKFLALFKFKAFADKKLKLHFSFVRQKTLWEKGENAGY